MTKGAGDQAARLRGELARLGPLTPFEILGLLPTAGSEDVRAAFLAATKKFHPSLFGRGSPDVQDLATEVFLVIKRAYSQLSDEAKRKAQKERLVGTQERTLPTGASMAPAGPRSATTENPPVLPARAAPDSQPLAPPLAAPSAKPATVPPRGPVPKPATVPPRGAAPAPRPTPPPFAVPQRPAPRPTPPPFEVPPRPVMTPSERPPRQDPTPPPQPVRGAQRPGPTTDVQAILDAAKTRSSRFEQANHLMTRGQFGTAREILVRITTEDPQNRRYKVRLHLAAGLEHRGERRFEEALRELERGLALDPENAEVAEALTKTREQAAQRGILSKLFGR